jgi:hypothetical protein
MHSTSDQPSLMMVHGEAGYAPVKPRKRTGAALQVEEVQSLYADQPLCVVSLSLGKA